LENALNYRKVMHMKKYSAFDILGPIMIGPSSSHTAGAARLGKIAAIIASKKIKAVEFLLHGSFAKTYRGHGTDRALAAGILGMDPWDERLRDALDIAKEKGIQMNFDEITLEDAHPNTVKFVIRDEEDSITEVVGSSIGGGSIIITSVDGEEIEFTGEYPTLIIKHRDVPGVVSNVTTLMYSENINIAFMKVFRGRKGENATMIFETDNILSETLIDKIDKIKDISSIKVINPINEG
jgi:L-serine dehydratase